MAGGFHAAERETGVGGDHGIDEDHAGFEFVDEALALGRIVGPGAGAEAEAAVIGDAQGLINIFHAENAGDGAEEFLAIGGGIFRNVCKNCGRDRNCRGLLTGFPPVRSFAPA